jgi:hypothetical protein
MRTRPAESIWTRPVPVPQDLPAVAEINKIGLNTDLSDDRFRIQTTDR